MIVGREVTIGGSEAARRTAVCCATDTRKAGGVTIMSKEALGLALEQLEKKHRFSGAILISQYGETIFEQVYGFASRQLKVPNTLETKFHLASTTKMFIAMAALVLSEQGRLSLHERPVVYVPELASLDRGITIHHLLSHTAGLQEIYNVPNLRFEACRVKHDQGVLFPYLVALPPLFHPGDGWSYSSTGYILMGYILEKVTGESFADVLRHYVLGPLAMTNTGLDLPRRINPGRAYGHTVEGGQFVNADDDELSLFEEAPGELYSTVRNLKTWCDAMFDCPLVSPTTLRLMFTPHGQGDAARQYGYGWFLTPRFRMHGGETPGFRALIRQYPDRRLSVILLLNSDHVQPWTICNAIEPLLLDGPGATIG
jgi:CubicO group peptidase (beta-lactamase class C family)